MPMHNCETYVGQALESILRDGYRPFEVIAVDDGSSDNTAQIIRQYENVRYVYQDNEGVASARNKGISLSRGEIIAFMDCDDIWLPDRLTVTVRFFQQHPGIGYVLAKQMMFIEPGFDVPAWVKPEWLEWPQDASNTAVLASRRTTFDRVGLFNSDIGGEDTEWLVRASEAGVPMARLQEAVVRKRIHGGNLSIKMLGMRKNNLMRIARESIHRQQEKKGNHEG
ncbi:MAG TPA: glycosyltransferase family A protein [Thermodesulfovibrionales bacterium]|nr:glycosyltransferase family A protein [Thermodesulfovibrionales bacterium]